MLSDKLELNSVRALGRLELTSWEHIPGWAEIQPPLGKTCESMAGLWWPVVAAGVLSALVATPALGIGARSLWKAGLFRQAAWRERGLSQATPERDPFPPVALSSEV